MGMMQEVAVMRKRKAHDLQVSRAEGAKSMAAGWRSGNSLTGGFVGREGDHAGVAAGLSRGRPSARDEVDDGGKEEQAKDQKRQEK